MVKVSIIMPIYNTERYLKMCLDSVIGQTLQDIEIICVNDCSTDGSLDILKQYQAQDERIKIIDLKKNGDVSAARNIGMKEAKGEYIGFMDSDDTVDLDFYEKLYNKAKATDAEIVKGVFNTIAEKYSFKTDLNIKIKKNKTYFYGEFTTAIYKTDFLLTNSLFFDEKLKTWEDPLWSIQVTKLCNKLELENSVCYNYFRRLEGKSHKADRAHVEDWIRAAHVALNVPDNEEDYIIILKDLIIMIFFTSLYNVKDQETKEYAVEQMKAILKLKPEYSFERDLDKIQKEWNKEKLKLMANKIREYQNIKVSVIIPVYNVEAYLQRCLDSVIHQTLRNIEIICVDDCSPDNSAAILEKYANEDCRVKIVKREFNGGLSAARNSGLKEAKGEYIYFLDSDDWIAWDYLEKMYRAISVSNLPAVCNTNVVEINSYGVERKFLKRDFDEGFKPYHFACQMAWSWILKKSFLAGFDCVFPEGLKYEDTYFFNVLIRSLKDVYIINSSKYYHFENENSIMGCAKNRVMKDFDSIKVVECVYDYYKKHNLLSVFSVPFFYLHQYSYNHHAHKEEYIKLLKAFYEKIEPDVMENKNLYSDLELDFFTRVLAAEAINEKQALDTSIIGALRKNIRKANVDITQGEKDE